MTPAPPGLDAAPLLASRTGVGSYVRGLWAELPFPVAGCVAAWRRAPAPGAPARAARAWRTRRVPFRIVESFWRASFLPAERLFGPLSLYHATSFFCPPRARVPLVATVHDLSPYEAPGDKPPAERLRYAVWISLTLSRADRVIVPTRAVAGEVSTRFPAAAPKLRVVPYGVAPEWFAAERPRARAFPPYVLSVGAVSPRKNLATAIAAFAAAAPRLPRAWRGLRYRIVGPEGAHTGALREAARAAGIADRVSFGGYLPPEELVATVAAAEAVLYPSRYEGMGLPPLEAMACGTPVLASDAPAVAEAVGDGALVLPRDEPRAWADALTALLSGASVRRSQAGKGRRRARRFTWPATARGTAAVYREVAAA